MDEVWLPVVGYEAFYEVSNLGRVKSKSSRLWQGKTFFIAPPKIMHIYTNRHGYCWLTLNAGICPKNHFLHRLVIATFLPNPNPNIYTEINHIDGNKSNNALNNLGWCTSAENKKHARAMGLYDNMIARMRNSARKVEIVYPDGLVIACSSSSEAWAIIGNRKCKVQEPGFLPKRPYKNVVRYIEEKQ